MAFRDGEFSVSIMLAPGRKRYLGKSTAPPGEFAGENAYETSEHNVSKDDFKADDECRGSGLGRYVTEPEGGERNDAVVKEVWKTVV